MEWNSTLDRLPEVKGNYLVYYNHEVWIAHFDKCFFIAKAVTHWQSLPEPPKETNYMKSSVF